MIYILHIDTSGSTGTVALAQDGIILATETTDDTRNQAAVINIMTDKVLVQAGIKPAELSAVAVCGGPGSYTGLRIGMATAKGLCYALDIPLLADNKLTLLAGSRQAEYKNRYTFYITLLTAREKEYFITAYDEYNKCIIKPQHILEDHIVLPQNGNKYIITDIPEEKIVAIAGNNAVTDNNVFIDLKYWAKAAKEAYLCNEFVNLTAAEPFYLKDVYTHK